MADDAFLVSALSTVVVRIVAAAVVGIVVVVVGIVTAVVVSVDDDFVRFDSFRRGHTKVGVRKSRPIRIQTALVTYSLLRRRRKTPSAAGRR